MDLELIKIEKLSEEEIKLLSVREWPLWEKEVSTFHWLYESQERCLFLEGKVDIVTKDGTVHIGVGDFVTFAKGLECEWQIQKAVKKHYNFN